MLDTVRNKIPNIAIRTTFISGYPGETEQDHETLIRFLEELRFERVGVFTYSHEENTHAYTLNDDVDETTKQRRLDELMQVQQNISDSINQKKIGKSFKTLFDRKEGNYFVGRTEYDSPEVDNEVLVDANENYVRVGDFANIKITSAEAFDLYGTLS